ncbi:hypothetical protein [Crateriforma spongiae]|uniref:hypothetical protein n=1 Tax=Crateriforma spongiae TaxID=2724528 RepID=UPI0039B05F11
MSCTISRLLFVLTLLLVVRTTLAESPEVTVSHSLSDAEYKNELNKLLTKFKADIAELQSRRTAPLPAEGSSDSARVVKHKFRPKGIRRPANGSYSTQPAVVIAQQRPNADRKWALHILIADGRSIVLPCGSQFDQQHGTWKFSTDGLSYTWREGRIGDVLQTGAIDVVGDNPYRYRYSSENDGMSNAIGQPVAGDLFDVIKTWLSHDPESTE